MKTKSKLREKIEFYMAQESVALGIRSDKILQAFSEELDELEGKARSEIVIDHRQPDGQNVIRVVPLSAIKEMKERLK